MPRGGDTYGPEVQLLLELDRMAIDAGLLAAGYHGEDADPREDRVGEWEEELLTHLAGRFAPEWLPHIERAKALRRAADARCDVWVDGKRDSIHASKTRAVEYATALIGGTRTSTPAHSGAALTDGVVAAALIA